MEEKRVVVTGLGAVTPIGVGVDLFWKHLLAGKNGIFRVTRFDPSDYRTQVAGEVDNFDPNQWIDKKSAGRMDRVVQFAIVAADMAFRDAGLDDSAFDVNRAGVMIGSGVGGIKTIEDELTHLHAKGPKSISPFFLSRALINMPASMVSIRYGLKGPLGASSVACSTGANSIGDAFRVIQRGDADIMLAGSTDASITPLSFGGFCATRSMTTRNDNPEKASRPFDKNRDGFVMGEGAGIVVLENLDHALSRQVGIYAEVAGYCSTADAFHVTAPEPNGDGMTRVMDGALKDSGVRPEEIGYINAHGTSTLLNDKIETLAIVNVFQDHANRLKISSIKSMIGHLLAGAGSVEFISLVKSVETGNLPPTINYEDPDPECPLDYITGSAEKVDLQTALTNNFGFGGGNACLVVRKMNR